MSQVMLPADVTTSEDGPPILRSLGLMAEYSVGQTEPDGWFAIGTVRGAAPAHYHPAWVIVGTGISADAAVADLQMQLEIEARHLIVTT